MEGESGNIGTAIRLFEEVIKANPPTADDLNEECIKAKEQASYRLAGIYQDKGLVEELISLAKQILPVFKDFPKSKLARIIRSLFDMALKVEGKLEELVDLSKYIIDWCVKEERSFLRMRIETYLSDLYYRLQKYNDAIQILTKLNFELKKKEDKQLLVESQLIEAKVY